MISVSKLSLANIKNLPELARNLMISLRDITFKDNFRSFTYEATISANSEVKIRNRLTVRPNSYIIRFQTGDALVTAGTTIWDDDFLYMQNHDATNAATVKITFWRE
jgi:hypothetical protein